MTINTKTKEEKQTTPVDPEWANWVRQVAVYTVDDLTRTDEVRSPEEAEMEWRLMNLIRELKKLQRLEHPEAHEWTQIYINRIRELIDLTPLAQR